MKPESLYEVLTDDLDMDAPVLVHALSGFLDAGGARQLAVEHLLESCEHRVIAQFDIDTLYDYRARRPRMIFDTDHYAELDYPQLLLYELRDERGTPFLLLTGPEPDVAWRAFTVAVVQLVERFGVSRSIGMNAIPWPAPHTRPVGVTAHATDPAFVAGRPTFVGAIEVPGHLAGGVELALGEAGHLALGFAAHVPHYLSQVLFPRAAIALLEEVGVAGSLSFDLSELEIKAGHSMREINEQLAGNAENEQAVRDLELQYDEIVRGAANALPLATDGPLPSGDDIAAQFQEFLRELDDDKGRSE